MATISDALIIGGSVFVVCIVLIYILFFRGKIQEQADCSPNALPACKTISDAEYELITQRLLQIKGKYSSVLFAASAINCLPITIPVNVGVSLARKGIKCLLIDTDIRRNAIAKAFDLDESPQAELPGPRGYKTSFNNLRLWPAHNFAHKNPVLIKDLIEGAKNEFDFVIINAPYLPESSDHKQIAGVSDSAFIFAQNAADAAKLSTLMKSARTSIIGNVKIAHS